MLGANVPLLASVLLASFLGSLHCALMCGPFVAVFSGSGGHCGTRGASMRDGRTGRLVAQLGYHASRAGIYVTLGALAGAIGGGVNFAFSQTGLVHASAILSALVILWGLGAAVPQWRALALGRSPLRHVLVQLGTKPRVVRASVLGLLTPLLPCGWLYAFVLTAAGTGSALTGAGVMGAFFLGTVPALLGVGAVAERLGALLGPRLPAFTGALLVTIGLLGVITRVRMPLPAGADQAAQAPSNAMDPDGSARGALENSASESLADRDRPLPLEVPSDGPSCH